MNRATSHQQFLFKDCSVMTELAYRPIDKLNIFAKYTYDVNHSGTEADMLVFDGSELQSVGAGIEYYPIRKKMDIRLHANYSYAWGNNTNPDGIMQDRQHYFTIGATWSMNVFQWRRKEKSLLFHIRGGNRSGCFFYPKEESNVRDKML
jgi:hypothetical protein